MTERRSGRRIPWRGPLAYALFAVAAFVGFMVWRFPVEAVQNRVLAEIQQRTGTAVTVRERAWLFPVGIGWRGVRAVPHDRPDQAIDLEAVSVRMALLPLVSRRIETDIGWEAYGGKARGSLTVRREANGARFSLDQFGQGFDLAKIPALPPGAWSGRVQITLDCRWLNDAWWMGEGAGSLELSQVKVDGLVVAGFPVNGVEFDALTGQVALKGGTLTIQRVAGRGPLGAVSGDGTILVRSPWSESVITLTLRLEPSALAKTRVPILALSGDKDGAVTVRISGRVGRPNVSVNGASIPMG